MSFLRCQVCTWFSYRYLIFLAFFSIYKWKDCSISVVYIIAVKMLMLASNLVDWSLHLLLFDLKFYDFLQKIDLLGGRVCFVFPILRRNHLFWNEILYLLKKCRVFFSLEIQQHGLYVPVKPEFIVIISWSFNLV